MEKTNKYSLGIDLGTNSVGWAVTDENGDLVKKNGKTLWGVRLFEEAETCKSRRLFRSSRRRLLRRKQRLSLLQDIFAEEISSIDPYFFQRLHESKYHLEDKQLNSDGKTKYVIINDKNYSDKDFYDDYKTIYHLRNELLKTDSKVDIRYLYLCMHHMIKYRGHFLFEGEFKPGDERLIKSSFEEINYSLNLLEECDLFHSNLDEVIQSLKELYKNDPTITKIKEEYSKYTNSGLTKKNKELIITLLSGGKIGEKKLSELLGTESPIKELRASSEKFDEDVAQLSSIADCNIVNIFNSCKRIYDAFKIYSLLGESSSISQYMCEIYETHKKQLKKFKAYVKTLSEKDGIDYTFELFRKVQNEKDNKKKDSDKEKNNNLNNYCFYVGLSGNNSIKHCSKEDFYKYVKTLLKLDNRAKDDDEQAKKWLELINDNKFLPKQNDSGNGIFPYQLNLYELKEILKKQAQFYPFLKDVSDGLTGAEKIEKLLTFKIPYYVGPLPSTKIRNDEFTKYSWAVRNEGKEDIKITPYNFDDVINKTESAEAFIKRMLNKCTFIKDEDCLPKGSMLYSYYSVLQDLNNLKVNGAYFTKEEKIDIISNVYLDETRKSKPKIKDIEKYLKRKNSADPIITTTTGKDVNDDDFNGDLDSIRKFIKIFKTRENVIKNYDLIEKIIVDITIFEDKEVLKERFKTYKCISEEQLKSILSLTFKKNSSISRKFLNLCEVDEDGVINEESLSIIDKMLNTNMHLNQILEDKGVKRALELSNPKNPISGIDIDNKDAIDNKDVVNDKDSLNKYINDLYVSPLYKRSLTQAILIIIELEKILSGKGPRAEDIKIGTHINKFYIESTRTDKADKKRTNSRKDKLIKLYKEAKDINNSLKEDLKNGEYDEKIKSKKFYLYLLQEAKDIYTGEPIDIHDIDSYDIDHIIPQSIIKDDSLNNIVLTKRTVNERKKDIYPLSDELVSSKAKDHWVRLKKYNLMSAEKYARLIRNSNSKLTDDELNSFVNRQIVATSQSVKALKDFIEDNSNSAKSKVYLVKAEYISEVRNQFSIVKSRMANNFHHAHDAYLCATVGKTMYDFYNNQIYNKENHYKWSANLLKPIIKTKRLIDDLENDKINSKSDIDKTYQDIKKVFDINKIKYNIQTRFDIMVTERTYFKKGALFDQNPISVPDNKSLGKIALKKDPRMNNYNKYGAYNKPNYNKYALKFDNNKWEIVNSRFDELIMQNLFPIGTSIERKTENNVRSSFRITGVTGDQFVVCKNFECYLPANIYNIVYKIEKIQSKLIDKKIDTYKKFKNKQNETKDKDVDDEQIIINMSDNPYARISSTEYTKFIEFLFSLATNVDNNCYFSVKNCLSPLNNDLKNKLKDKNITLIEKHFISIELLKLINRKRLTSNLLFLKQNEDEIFSSNAGNTTWSGILNEDDCIIEKSITGYYVNRIYPYKMKK